MAFSGASYYELPSRKEVARLVEAFLQSTISSTEVTVAAILGEWGEGKTELYEGKIRPAAGEIGYPFFVPASTVANSYDLPRVKRLIETTGNEAVRFLVVLLDSIRSTKLNNSDSLPDATDFESAEEYVFKCLNQLATKSPKNRCIVFVDEFEELVNKTEKLLLIVSGIKELVNGMYQAVHREGEFPGLIHLILACTPAAYYRISRDRELEHVFGGFSRRVSRIDLVPPRFTEVIEFIERTIRWAWKENLPSPHPFRNTGVHETLAYVSRGNLGVLVQLIAKVLSDPGIEKIESFDGERILSILQTHVFSVLGAEASALESGLYRDICSSLAEQQKGVRGRQLVSVFRTIAGEQIPHDVEDLRKAAPTLFNAAYEVKSAVDLINQGLLKGFRIDHSIIKLRRLPASTSALDVVNKLISSVGAKVTTERSEGMIFRLDDYRESYETLQDRLQHLEFDQKGNPIRHVYFPDDEQSARSFFDGISTDTAREMLHSILPKGKAEESVYILSGALKTQLFPSPVPRGLEFVVSQNDRLQLWRRVGRELDVLSDRHLPSALPQLLARLPPWETTPIDTDRASGREIWQVGKSGAMVRVALTPLIHNPGKPEIRSLIDIVQRKDHPAHLALLLYTGEMSEEAETTLAASKLGPLDDFRIVPLQLTVGLLRRLVAVSEAVRTFAERDIEPTTLRDTLDQLFSEELQFLPKLEEWNNAQVEKGLLIPPLRDAAANLGRQIETLRFYLNFPDGPRKPAELWATTQEKLMALQFYGEKSSIVPDEELPEFQRISEDLLANRFLRQDSDGYHVQVHPAEARLLALLQDGESHSFGQLSSQFVDTTGSNAVENVFLQVLKSKGLALSKGKNAQRLQPEASVKLLLSRYSELKFSARDSQAAFDAYGMLYVRKMRGDRFIPYTGWISMLDDRATELEGKKRLTSESLGPRVRLFGELLDKLEERILDPVRKASREADSVVKDLNATQREFRAGVRAALSEVEKGRARAGELTLIEERQLEEECERLRALHNQPVVKITEAEWKAIADEAGSARFQFGEQDEAVADYFNPKLAAVRLRAEEAKRKMASVSGDLNQAVRELKGLTESERKVSTFVRSIATSEELPVSSATLGVLLSRLVPTSGVSKTSPPPTEVHISDVKAIVEEHTSRRERELDALRESASQLRLLRQSESRTVDSARTLGKDVAAFQRRIGSAHNPKLVNEGPSLIKRLSGRSEIYLRRIKAEGLSTDPRRVGEIASEAAQAFDQLTSEIQQYLRQLSDETHRLVDICKSQTAVLREMAKSVSDFGDKEWVEVRVRDLDRIAGSLLDAGSPVSIEDFRTKLAEVEEGVYTRVGHSLGNDETHAKALQIALRETSKRDAIPLFELRKLLIEECKVSGQEADETLHYLFTKRLLEPLVRRGVRAL